MRAPAMRAIQAGLLACFLAATNAHAADTPESVFRDFFDVMVAEGPQKAVPRFTHPDELARLKKMLMPRVRRSFEIDGDTFISKIFGREMPLSEIEALTPEDFMNHFMWNTRLDGKAVKRPEIVRSIRRGDEAQLEILTEVTTLEGKRTQRHDFIAFKAMGDTWRLMLSPQMEAYVTVLISN
jgi:hypothetical protein